MPVAEDSERHELTTLREIAYKARMKMSLSTAKASMTGEPREGELHAGVARTTATPTTTALTRKVAPMKKLIVFALIPLMSDLSLAGEPLILEGECYQAVIKYEIPKNENILTICTNNNGMVSERMIFSNSESMPAVCYQSGEVKISKNKSLVLNYTNGSCDNGRPYENPPLNCILIEYSSMTCKDEYGEVTLEYVGTVK
jgi:hypothetical protein